MVRPRVRGDRLYGSWWWLQLPGNNQNNAANVNNDGNVNLNGNNVNTELGVRPALLPTPEACRKRGGLRGGVKGIGFPLASTRRENKSRRRRGRSEKLFSGPGEGMRPAAPSPRPADWK